MKYKLNIYFKNTENFEISISNFFSSLEKICKILSKQFIYYNNVGLEEFNPKSINCFIEISVVTNNSKLDYFISKMINDYPFITNYILKKDCDTSTEETISITQNQLNDIIDNIDKLFYIRKDLDDNLKHLDSNKKEHISNTLKNLSLTKYNLKSSVLSLRFVDLTTEFEEIKNILIDYAKSYGIDFKIHFNTNDIELDKLIYSKLKNSLISILSLFINEELELKQKNIEYTNAIISINCYQELNEFKLNISNNHLKFYNDFDIYTQIFENDFSYNCVDIAKQEKEMTLINYNNTIKQLNGRIYIDENCNIVTNIKLDFLKLFALIIKIDFTHYAIDKTYIEDIIEFDNSSIFELDNNRYYGYKNYKFPILNEISNPKNILIVKIDNNRYAYPVHRILYEEKIFATQLSAGNSMILGYSLLKDTKKAHILNLKSILLEKKMKKNTKLTIKKDIDTIDKLLNFILRVKNAEKEDFQICVKYLNTIENDTFYLKILNYYDLISLIRKLFIYIDKNRMIFYEYKYILFSAISNLKKFYIYYLNFDDYKNDELDKVFNQIKSEIEAIIETKNENKSYYYIKIQLDTNIPFFYLSRKMILLNLKEFGKPYNYTPETLDDDISDYFILEYRVEKEKNIQEIFEKIKSQDEAIVSYEINKLNSNNNLYNLKFYVEQDLNEHSCLMINDFKFLDILHYKNYYDTYIESKNQRYLLENLIKLKNKDIELISLKKINDREVNVFLPSGLNINNIDKIKKFYSIY